MKIRYWITILILFAFIRNSNACRFTIRDIGYSALNLESYMFHFEVDTLRYKRLKKAFIGQASNYSLNANVHYLISHESGQSPVLKCFNTRGEPIALIEVTQPAEIDKFFNEILFSPLQMTISRQIGDAFAFVVWFSNEKDKTVNGNIEKALAQFEKLSPGLDKKVTEHILQITIDKKGKEKEETILRSMGIDPDKNEPVVVIIYGRGRLAGEPMVGHQITSEHLLRQLVALGTDCECGIDLSPLLKRAIPFYWNREMRQDVADMLGIDVDNPSVMIEMGQILSKEPLETGKGVLSIAPQIIDLDKKLGAVGRDTTNVLQDISKDNRYKNLIITAGILFFIVAGAIFFIWMIKKV